MDLMLCTPRTRLFKSVLFVAVCLVAGILSTGQPKRPESRVTVVRTPNGGIQPQAVLDDQGTLHLVYFSGNPRGGDLYYVRRVAGSGSFSTPIRVNHRPGSSEAVGTVRGAHMAIGRSGQVHVAWMGSEKAEPKGPGGAMPMLYARMTDAKTGFEPERNVMQFATGLDGGASIAADRAGNVYVVWHAGDEHQGETKRRVWVATSGDDGKSFAREIAASQEPTGACGCCGMRCFSDSRGNLHILYRTADKLVDRNMTLLTSTDHGRTFVSEFVHPWHLNACPMSTAAISEGNRVLVAWETAGQVYYSRVLSNSADVEKPIPAPGNSGKRKHPAVAGNPSGESILVWVEGGAWEKGGGTRMADL